MGRLRAAPRKQRTRQHVIADQSVNYVERLIIDEGHTSQRVEKDYGYDLLLFTYDEQGYLEPGLTFLQVKASELPKKSGTDYAFEIDIRDYHVWVRENYPVFLVLFDATRRRAYWLHIQDYFQHDKITRQPRKWAKTVRVCIPKGQTLTRIAIERMRDAKWEVLDAANAGRKS